MINNIKITREPRFSRKPGPKITLEEWFGIIQRDPELSFIISSSTKKYGTTTASWDAHPNPGKELSYLWGVDGRIVAQYPNEHLLKKMIQISRLLNADVVGEKGEIYDLGADGSLITIDKHPSLPKKSASKFVTTNNMAYGMGASTCSDFTKKTRGSGKIPDITELSLLERWEYYFYSWYQGYVTATLENMTDSGESLIFAGSHAERRIKDMEFLKSYCKKYPDRRFHHAANALIKSHIDGIGQ
ncbi:hypothetical protein J2D73_11440 [Acetobacter sacchari]|uniref:Uncharacterized protein n=1 Tax=Acetobacter sacchari TaxID=2661687 RepID=A0ABS3LWX1_9PROT|nr:hypothetical protein [Acetobacter sacchari]MBO1360400.1 hypothetical protein [Acetobacter sacchari]